MKQQVNRPAMVLCWIGLLLLMLSAGMAKAAEEADPLTVQFSWKGGAEYTGYLVAQELGYYRAAGLEVELQPGGPDIDSLSRLVTGKADVAVSWLSVALLARQNGKDVVNIAQSSHQSFLMLACRKSAGIRTPADISGKTIAVWHIGDQTAVKLFLKQAGVAIEQVEMVQQGNFNLPLRRGKAVCSTIMFNDRSSWKTTGIKLPDLTLFSLDAKGSRFLEDGLYADGKRLSDPQYRARLARFLRATAKGWRYAKAHPRVALGLIMEHYPDRNYTHQQRMLFMVLDRVDIHPFGLLQLDNYWHAVQQLAQHNEDKAAILEAGKYGWTYRIWRQAGLDERPSQSLTPATIYYLRQTVEARWFHIFMLFSIAVFGLSGFMRARRHHYDIFGAFSLTFLPALGGSVLRDVVIGHHPVSIIQYPAYLLVSIAVVLIGYAVNSLMPEDIDQTSGFRKRMLIFDSIGPAIGVIGAVSALLYGLPWWWALLCAAMTSTGGGILMDIVTGREPASLKGEFYEELAMFGGLLLFLGLLAANHFEHVTWLVPALILAIFLLMYCLRLLAATRHWRSWRMGTPYGHRSMRTSLQHRTRPSLSNEELRELRR